jgi:hypothetical protein
LAFRAGKVNRSIFQKNRLQSARQQSGRGPEMNLTPPSAMVFIVSLILWALAVIGKFAAIPFVTENGFLLAIVAYAVLAVGNLFRGV